MDSCSHFVESSLLFHVCGVTFYTLIRLATPLQSSSPPPPLWHNEFHSQHRMMFSVFCFFVAMQSALSLSDHTIVTNTNTYTHCRVVRTEMATVCAYVISAFLVANISESENRSTGKNQTDLLDDLQQQLMVMAKVGLPADYHLREQSILAEARLSIGVVWWRRLIT